MPRLLLPTLFAATLAGCAAETPQPELPPLIAPTPTPAAQPLVLRRCDDGGDGGVLIDGICL